MADRDFGRNRMTRNAETIIIEFCRLGSLGGEIDPPNEDYCQIYQEGARCEFNDPVNDHWLEYTRPVMEAFWHTRYFIQMMVRYAKKLETAPQRLPSGWAAVLHLFELR